jgi:hypothetical protein
MTRRPGTRVNLPSDARELTLRDLIDTLARMREIDPLAEEYRKLDHYMFTAAAILQNCEVLSVLVKYVEDEGGGPVEPENPQPAKLFVIPKS